MLAVVALVLVAAAVSLVVGHPWTSAIQNPVTCAEEQCGPGGTTTTLTAPVVPISAPLIFLVPDAVHGPFYRNCLEDQTSTFVSRAVEEQVACDLSGVPTSPEDYVVYLAFGSAAAADGYFEQTLVRGNGLEDGIGDCTSAVLPGAVGMGPSGSSDTTSGSYCVQSPGPDGIGHILGVQGPGFSLGGGLDVAQVCAGSGVETAGHTFAVVAWTDPHVAVVAVAATCGGSVLDIVAGLRHGRLLLTT